MRYSYDPGEIGRPTVSRARFELGDVMSEGGEQDCLLADAEILAVIEEEGSWVNALYRLADAVCKRLSFETDWSDDGAAFKLSQRADRWMKMRDALKKEAGAADCQPAAGSVQDSLKNPQDGGHYFYGGMMQSPYVKPDMPMGGGAHGTRKNRPD